MRASSAAWAVCAGWTGEDDSPPRAACRSTPTGRSLDASPSLAHVCLAPPSAAYYITTMKTLTVRLPEPLVSEIEAESRARGISKSDVVRERLRPARSSARRRSDALHDIADLIGSVDGLPVDLSARRRRYLAATGYGQKRAR